LEENVLRALAAVLLLPLLAVPAVAHAAPSCYQLTDATDDAVGLAGGVAAPRSDSDMDVARAGIATTATLVGAVVDLYAFSPVDTMAPTGRRFDVTFVARGATRTVSVVVGRDGTILATPGAVVKTDFTAFQLRVAIPLKTLGLTLRTASRRPRRAADAITGLSVTSRRWTGDLATGSQVGDVVDSATVPRFRYEHRAPSCVKPGR
jgi:hypothetical protein